MTSRRQVRVSAGFFEQLDEQLRPDRGPQGEPSATDFIAFELPAVIEHFAEHFGDLPEALPGVPTARVLTAPGLLVGAFAVFGLLAEDDAIDLIGISIDP